jgi:hypothetical protein
MTVGLWNADMRSVAGGAYFVAIGSPVMRAMLVNTTTSKLNTAREVFLLVPVETRSFAAHVASIATSRV